MEESLFILTFMTLNCMITNIYLLDAAKTIRWAFMTVPHENWTPTSTYSLSSWNFFNLLTSSRQASPDCISTIVFFKVKEMHFIILISILQAVLHQRQLIIDHYVSALLTLAKTDFEYQQNVRKWTLNVVLATFYVLPCRTNCV